MSDNTAWPGHSAPLGVTHDGLGVNVAVWSDGAESVEFCVFDANGAERRFQLAEHTFHVFHGYIPGVDPGAQYGFRVNGPWDPARGLRYNPAKLLIDPYAKAITGILRDHPAASGSIGDDLTRNDED
ncbi:MAG: glycogen debranching enzyme GlgX, partial [Candidatus Nanopelagicales bacterium]|nr:glycogen debranching enzyme GlgX [Candidatus Nanopelagicales bacterium]